MRSAPPWLQRICIIALIFPVALIWGEIFTRIFAPQNLDSWINIYKTDPIIGFIYEENATTYQKGREFNVLYRTNSQGLRDREYGKKENGVFRVLLLGDSFSVSHGLRIEDSLSKQLERALQDNVDASSKHTRIEVINAAIGGYSPYNYWRAYQKWAPVFNPDIVVVGLSPDDYDNDNEYASYLIEAGETLAVFKEGQAKQGGGGNIGKKVRKWLSGNSEFYILMRNYFYYNELVGRVSLWASARGKAEQSQLEPYTVPQSENMTKAWEKTFSYLRLLKKDVSADGVGLIVLPLPLKMEIIPEQYEQAITASGMSPAQVDRDQVLKGIRQFCKEANIVVLDPRAALRQRHEEVPCYFVYDGHWNAEGVRAATLSIASQWRDMRLPPWDNR